MFFSFTTLAQNTSTGKGQDSLINIIYTKVSNPWTCAFQINYMPDDGFLSTTTVNNPTNGFYCDETSRITGSYICKNNFCWSPDGDRSFNVIKIMPSGSIIVEYHRCYLGDAPNSSRCSIDNPELYVNSKVQDEGTPSVFEGFIVTEAWPRLTVEKRKEAIENASSIAKMRCEAFKKFCAVDPDSLKVTTFNAFSRVSIRVHGQ